MAGRLVGVDIVGLIRGPGKGSFPGPLAICSYAIYGKERIYYCRPRKSW